MIEEQIVEPRVSIVADVRPDHRGYWRASTARLAANRAGVAAAAFIVLVALVAISAPLISRFVTHYDPSQQDLTEIFAPPTRQHWLGTDQLGRDTLTRLVWGARVSLGVAFLTVAIALALGTIVGLVAGYYRAWVDEVLMRFVDVLLAIPAIFLFIMLGMLLKPNAVMLAVIIASVSWVSVSRLVRAEVLSLRTRDFMLAARSLGASDARLMSRHLFPGVIPVMIVAASLSVGQIILIEAALDFLGLGIQLPTPSWGNMISAAQVYFLRASTLALFPGLTIFFTVLATNVAGNAIRDAFDPSLQ